MQRCYWCRRLIFEEDEEQYEDGHVYCSSHCVGMERSETRRLKHYEDDEGYE